MHQGRGWHRELLLHPARFLLIHILIRIFPGVYREEPSREVTFNDPKCSKEDPKYWEPTGDSHGEDGKVHAVTPRDVRLTMVGGKLLYGDEVEGTMDDEAKALV